MALPTVEYKCYVGKLSFKTTDESLKKKFSVFGKVIKAEVMIDHETGKSRGFGFVTFADGKVMKEAIDGMNGRDLDGRVIVVNQAQSKGNNKGGSAPPRPEQKVRYQCKVSYLQPYTTEETLRNAFSMFGKVLSADIVYDEDTGESQSYGYVTFSTEKAMKDAIDGMDGEMIDRRSIEVVMQAQPKGIKRNNGGPKEVVYNCYVGNLSDKTSVKSLRKAFNRFGMVLKIDIIERFDEYRNDYLPKGYVFVSFSTEKEMNAAIQEMNGKELDGCHIIVQKSNRT